MQDFPRRRAPEKYANEIMLDVFLVVRVQLSRTRARGLHASPLASYQRLLRRQAREEGGQIIRPSISLLRRCRKFPSTPENFNPPVQLSRQYSCPFVKLFIRNSLTCQHGLQPYH